MPTEVWFEVTRHFLGIGGWRGRGGRGGWSPWCFSLGTCRGRRRVTGFNGGEGLAKLSQLNFSIRKERLTRWTKSSLQSISFAGARPSMKSVTCKFFKVIEKWREGFY